MTPAGRRRARKVREWLVDEGPAFDFFQAVRLLELTSPDSAGVGEQGAQDRKEAVQFRARVGFDFPATAIHEVLDRDRDVRESRELKLLKDRRAKDDPGPPI